MQIFKEFLEHQKIFKKMTLLKEFLKLLKLQIDKKNLTINQGYTEVIGIQTTHM